MGEKGLEGIHLAPGVMLPEGFERSPGDPKHAVNPKTGQKAVWNDDWGRWVDEQTGSALPPRPIE